MSLSAFFSIRAQLALGQQPCCKLATQSNLQKDLSDSFQVQMVEIPFRGWLGSCFEARQTIPSKTKIAFLRKMKLLLISINDPYLSLSYQDSHITTNMFIHLVPTRH